MEAQIRELRDALEVMWHKVRIYEEHVERGEADRFRNPSRTPDAPAPDGPAPPGPPTADRAQAEAAPPPAVRP
ncbi:hypothetical protein [Streptomyces sp. NPDC090021]|uniref:hypothetical protein n=1 Tax=Streptomyces sp. NPDC090021 TaxID=3365919 RepID=UPI00381BC751